MAPESYRGRAFDSCPVPWKVKDSRSNGGSLPKYGRQIAFTGTLNYDQVPVAIVLLVKGGWPRTGSATASVNGPQAQAQGRNNKYRESQVTPSSGVSIARLRRRYPRGRVARRQAFHHGGEAIERAGDGAADQPAESKSKQHRDYANYLRSGPSQSQQDSAGSKPERHREPHHCRKQPAHLCPSQLGLKHHRRS